jgi:PAS domain S-box-containing protein
MENKDAWLVTDALHVQQGRTEPFSAAIRSSRMAMILTDPKLPDNPIIYANPAFLRLTGYTQEEVVGRNCRFLQGAKTDRNSVQKICEAIGKSNDIAIDIINYKKDGSEFWNSLYISPVMDDAGVAQYYFASQFDATERKQRDVDDRKQHDLDALNMKTLERLVQERTKELEEALQRSKLLVHEVDHRVKNNLQMISAMLMLQSMSISDVTITNTLQSMLERIEAMGLVHKRLYSAEEINEFDISEFTQEIADNLVSASGRSDITLMVEVEPVKIKADSAASIALVINETITNALKHAFPVGQAGQLHVSVKSHPDACEISIKDNGCGMAGDVPTKNNFGKTLIETLIKQLKATIKWVPASPGTEVRIWMPTI